MVRLRKAAALAATLALLGSSPASASPPAQPTFSSRTAYFGMWRPFDVETADFDLDGALDVAVTDFNSHSVVVWPGLGDGTLGDRVEYPLLDWPAPTGIVATDLNGDLRPDIAFASGLPSVHVMLSRSDGTLADPVVTPTSGTGYQLAVGDVDDDHDQDLIVSGAAGSVDVLLGAGDGTFPLAVSYQTGGSEATTGVGVADFNGDKRLDIAAADSNGGVYTLIATGTGDFEAGSGIQVGGLIREIAVADVNRDKLPDIVLTQGEGGGLQLVVSTRSGALVRANSIPSMSGTASVVVGHLNSDKYVDVVAGSMSPGGVSVTAGTKAGQSDFPQVLSEFNAYGVAIADMNGDGQRDILAAEEREGSVAVFLNTTHR